MAVKKKSQTKGVRRVSKKPETDVFNEVRSNTKTTKRVLHRFKYALLALLLITLLYLSKSLFVAAVVDGKPIFRWSVNKILEEQGASQTLDFLIVEKLVSSEAQKRKIDVKMAVEEQIKKESETVTAQGTTLDEWLSYQGYTRTIYEKELKIRKEAEEILKDKLIVSDDEIKSYLAENKSLYEGKEETEELKGEIRETLRQQKFNTEFGKWIEEAKSASNILYLTNFSETGK